VAETIASTGWSLDRNGLSDVDNRRLATTHRPSEAASLVDRGQADMVRATRKTFQSAMRDEFIQCIEGLTGRRVENYESVVFVHPQMALEIFMLESPDDASARIEREAAEDAGQPRPTAGIDGS
jgi:hypothetical protein